MTAPNGAPTPSTGSRKRLLRYGVIALVAAVALAGVGLWWFLRDDSPDAVSLATATETLESVADTADTEPAATETSEAAAESETTEAAPAATEAAAGLDGTWSVDTSVGEFSFEDSTGTFVGFRVQEELSTIGSTTAVGRTPDVTGTIEIDGTTLLGVEVEATMSTITTNDSRRDSRARDALDTDNFPTATFELTEPIDVGEAGLDGEPVSTQATGLLTIKGVSQDVTIDLQAQLIDDIIVVVGSLDVLFSDFGVEVPTAPIVLSVDDFGVIEMQLFFRRS